VSEGTNYLAVCDAAAGEGSEAAGACSVAIREVLSGKSQYFDLEYPCHSPDRKRWFVIRVTPFPGDDSRRVIVAHEDITKRKLAEMALQESEERFRRAILGAPLPIMIHSEDGQVVTINSPWTRLTGYEHSDIPTITDWTHKAYGTQMDLVRADIDGLFALNEPNEEGEYAITTSSGDFRIWAFSSAPIGQLPDGRRLVISMAMDVTERKQAEDKLQERERYLSTVLHTTRDGFWVLDAEGRFVDVNDAYCRMSGYTRDELLQLRIPDIEALEKPDETAARIQRVMKAGSDLFQTQHRRKDGSIFDVEVSVSSMRASSRQFVCFCRDITEKNQIIEALRQSEERFRNIVNSMQDIVFTLDAEGRHTGVYGSWVWQFGLTPEHFLGRTSLEIMGEEDSRMHREANARAAQGEFVVYEWSVSNGQDTIEYQTSLSPVFDSEGNVIELVGVGRNVTEQKRTEQALRASEERLHSFVFNSPLLISEFDPYGCYLLANPAVADTFNLSPPEIVGKTFGELLAPEVCALFKERIARVLATLEPVHVEDSLKVGDDERFFNTTLFPLFDDKGSIRSIGGIAHDISARIEAEKQLQQSRDLFRSLTANIPGVVCRCWMDTVRVVDYMSEDVEDLTGYHAGDFVGNSARTWESVIHRDDIEHVDRRIKDAIASGQPWRVEYRIRHRDGSIRWVSETGRATQDTAEEALLIDCLLLDITLQVSDREGLQRSHGELLRLAAHLQTVREEERAAVAWELHDEVGQALAVVKMDLFSCHSQLPIELQGSVQQKLSGTVGLLDNTIDRLRKLYASLRPGMLDDLGLSDTIDWSAREFARESGIDCRIVRLDQVTVNPRDTGVSLAAFRVFQEILSNGVRHSGATRFEVGVERYPERVVIWVNDDGFGVSEENLRAEESLDLASMRERLRAYGGSVTIRRSETGGTIAQIGVPLPAETWAEVEESPAESEGQSQLRWPQESGQG